MVNISKIENLIKEKGWKAPYFCALFDHDRTWISDWKRGRGIPDENMLRHIADTLNTTVDYLSDKSEQKNKPTVSDEPSSKDKKIMELFGLLNGKNKKLALAQIELILKSQDNK